MYHRKSSEKTSGWISSGPLDPAVKQHDMGAGSRSIQWLCLVPGACADSVSSSGSGFFLHLVQIDVNVLPMSPTTLSFRASRSCRKGGSRDRRKGKTEEMVAGGRQISFNRLTMEPPEKSSDALHTGVHSDMAKLRQQSALKP
jgi:hypothetical protein